MSIEKVTINKNHQLRPPPIFCVSKVNWSTRVRTTEADQRQRQHSNRAYDASPQQLFQTLVWPVRPLSCGLRWPLLQGGSISPPAKGSLSNSRKTGRPAPLQSNEFLPPWRCGTAPLFAPKQQFVKWRAGSYFEDLRRPRAWYGWPSSHPPSPRSHRPPNNGRTNPFCLIKTFSINNMKASAPVRHAVIQYWNVVPFALSPTGSRYNSYV